MNIDVELLTKLEKLSHLNIDEKNREATISHLSDILDYVENLSELDTSSVDSYYSTVEGGTPMRDDVTNCNTEINKKILYNAPAKENNFFIVPAIIE